MPNIVSRGGVLAAALVCLVAYELRVCADDKPPEKLSLKSGYSGKMLVDGARRVSLSVTLDAKGGGSGTLTLDPNIRDGARSTTIAVREIPIRAQLVRDEEQAAKGRRLYELKRTGPEGKVDESGERWFLVRPLKEGRARWLLFADKDGRFQDILVLE